MVNNRFVLDETFAALSDSTRRAILARLAHGDCCVTDLPNPARVSLPAISKHLRVLEGAGLVTREKDGRIRRCCLNPAPLQQVGEWIAAYRRFWEKRLDALAAYLEVSHTKEDPPWPGKQPPKIRRSGLSGRSTPHAIGSSRHGPTRRR